MSDRRHIIIKIGQWAGAIVAIIAFFAMLGPPSVRFYEKTKVIYQLADSIEHVFEDTHFLLSESRKVDIIEVELLKLSARDKYFREQLDSLKMGKYPYDSLWLKDHRGEWYKIKVR